MALKEREIRNRRHNTGTTAKQVVMVWACVAKKDDDWVKKCMEDEVEGPGPRGRTTEDLERGCRKGLSST